MKIILTEEQYRNLIIENTIKDTLKELKVNSGILFTFGTGIGAFIGPVDKLLSGSGFLINEKEIILLIITAFALIIKDNESVTLLENVKEKAKNVKSSHLNIHGISKCSCPTLSQKII